MAKKQIQKGKPKEPKERWVAIIVNADGICRVLPGRRHVKKGETVALEVVNTRAKITFSAKHPFTTRKLGPHTIDRRDIGIARFNVRKDAKEGEYPYKVRCERTRKNAIGDSAPVMIIDP